MISGVSLGPNLKGPCQSFFVTPAGYVICWMIALNVSMENMAVFAAVAFSSVGLLMLLDRRSYVDLWKQLT